MKNEPALCVSLLRWLIPLMLWAGLPFILVGEEAIPIAIFDFDSKEDAVREAGAKSSAMINAHLSTLDTLITVERAELDKVLSEQELGLSGVIAPQTAPKWAT